MNPDSVEALVQTLVHADQHLYNLLLLNALCDPIIYAIRIRELRRGHVSILKHVFFCHRIDFKEFPRLRWKTETAPVMQYVSYGSSVHKTLTIRPSCSSYSEVEKDIPAKQEVKRVASGLSQKSNVPLIENTGV